MAASFHTSVPSVNVDKVGDDDLASLDSEPEPRPAVTVFQYWLRVSGRSADVIL